MGFGLSDWVSVLQTLALLVAAFLAFRAYQLATTEHRENRVEERRAPRRRLLLEAIEELKQLAQIAERVEPGGGFKRLDLITGQQKRFAIAIAFIRWAELRDCHAVVDCGPYEVSEKIDDAVSELNWDLHALDAGRFDKPEDIRVTYREGPRGELPPIQDREDSATPFWRWKRRR